MTPTKDDALAILRLWRREKNLINKSMIGATLTEQYVLDTVESALTQPPVDVEALKGEISKGATPSYAHVVSHTIDYLASKERLK